VELGAQTILLDLRHDKYLSAPTQTFHRILRGETVAQSEQLRTVLEAGEAQRDGDEAPPSRGDWRRILKPRGPTPAAFLFSCHWAKRALRSRRLDLAIRTLALGKGAHAPHAAVAMFMRWRPWWPARNVCLFDSLALSRFLCCAGADFHLAFGVRTGPFAAHCWVEADDAILNDEPEYCRSFTEIMRA
jgi:hypothetical protein